MGGDASVAPAKVTIRCSNGCKFPVEVSLGSTVRSFKELVAASSGIPSNQQRLIYKGRILKDEETLERYGVEYEHTIHLVRGSAPLPSSNTTPRSDTGDLRYQSSTNAGENTRGFNSAGVGGLGGTGVDSVFPGVGIIGMGGSAGLPGAGLTPAGLPGAGFPTAGLPGPGLPGAGLPGVGLPDLDQIRQQLTQNPNMMRDMMNMPFIQNLLNNPDTLRNVITSSPQIREILDRNPELSHILNDPNTLRQAIEATRNPGLMREMMRNTDRAMSNIESSPEGFNMLRRMYETVQEPFLNATTMVGDVGIGSGLSSWSTESPRNSMNTASDSNPSPNTIPLPNPWNNTAGAQNNTRAPPPGDGRAPGIPGIGGLGLPDFQGGMQDSSFFNQVMQNPAMSQMMQSLLSNPHYVNQIFSINPVLRNMLENNPQLREMLQNPEFLRHLASPETLRQILTLQRSLSSLGLQQPGDQTQRGATGIGTLNSMGMDQLIQMFTNLGSSGLGVPITSNVPPEELYANQLGQLQEMGFFDTQENIRALVATAGNVHAAVERLLGNTGQ